MGLLRNSLLHFSVFVGFGLLMMLTILSGGELLAHG
jgi:hypothetical protein